MKPLAHEYIIKIGEIALKGKNRRMFERRLKSNIMNQLMGTDAAVTGGFGRFYLSPGKADDKDIETVLSKTFGVVSFAIVYTADKNIESITEHSLRMCREMEKDIRNTTFKIEARRSDKSFPLTSYDIACHLGDQLQKVYPSLSVNMHKPDWTLSVEIREKALLYGRQMKGPGGLPAGIAGKGMLLLSGGIDSPVAGYMMAKRGLFLDAVYFHAYPYTSDDAKEKVKKLAATLSPYIGGLQLFVVPFTDVQIKIKGKAREAETTLLMRACMVKIAEMLAQKRGSDCLITGEALSQVASQTMGSIRFTGSMTSLPIFRPLIGMDKEEIIRIARDIETFETSILPFEDCCTIFSPKHPLVNPKLEMMRGSYNSLDIGDELNKAVQNVEVISL